MPNVTTDDSTKEDIDANFLDMLFTNNAMKTRRHGWLLIVFLYIKSVGVYSCHSFHAERPSHCPILLNEQRQKPTPICIRKNYLYPKGYKATMHNTHPWASTAASSLTESGSLRSFSASRTKRQVNALSYICSTHPSLLHILTYVELPISWHNGKILCIR